MPQVFDSALSCAEYLRRTLAHSPSVFWRLVQLASLCNPQSGRYADPLIAQAFPPEEIDGTVRRLHFEVFLEWLCLNLDQQTADLGLCLAGQDAAGEALRSWLRLCLYDSLIPSAATGAERQLFLQDLQMILPLAFRSQAG